MSEPKWGEVERLTRELEEARRERSAARAEAMTAQASLRRAKRELEAAGEEDAVRRTWELAVQRAYGCLDYCGGYYGAELKAFHSGIKTVIRALEAGLDTVDTQTAALDRIGTALRSEAQGDAALKHAMDNGFVRGVLHATEHVYEYGGSTHADELIEDLVDSFGPARVQGVARENGLSHSQRAAIEVAWRLRAARLGEGGGE